MFLYTYLNYFFSPFFSFQCYFMIENYYLFIFDIKNTVFCLNLQNTYVSLQNTYQYQKTKNQTNKILNRHFKMRKRYKKYHFLIFYKKQSFYRLFD